jgi:hypothetical protein
VISPLLSSQIGEYHHENYELLYGGFHEWWYPKISWFISWKIRKFTMDENWVYPYGLETSRKKTTYIGGNYHMQYSTTEGMCKGTPPTHVT